MLHLTPALSDYNIYWSGIVQFGIMMTLLLVSNILRRKVVFLKKSLLPVAVIGGFIGLFLRYLTNGSLIPSLELTILDTPLLSYETLSAFTYHGIAIGFAALTLKGIDRINGPIRKKPRAVASGMVIVNSYVIQGIFGILVSVILSFVFTSIPAYSGFLLPMGFGQGPGQALSVGTVFQNQGFTYGVNFGLTIAALGFVAASIGGIFYLQKLKKKGLLDDATESSMETDRQAIILEGQGQIPLVDAVDKLTIQFAIVGFVYLIAWILIFGAQQLILQLNVPFLINNIIPLLYGFNFIIVVFVAMLYKVITQQLLKSKVMSRIYTNDFMLNRIAGFAFDVMMIASIMAIDVSVVIEPGFLMTVGILSVGGTLLTYFYLQFLSKRVFPEYPHEAFLIFYGTMTGTASTGVALLREKDPYFKTPAANDIVYGSSMAIPLGFPLLLFVGFITLGWIYIGVILIVLIGIFSTYHYFLTKKKTI